jgi:hypothetical protein
VESGDIEREPDRDIGKEVDRMIRESNRKG